MTRISPSPSSSTFNFDELLAVVCGVLAQQRSGEEPNNSTESKIASPVCCPSCCGTGLVSPDVAARLSSEDNVLPTSNHTNDAASTSVPEEFVVVPGEAIGRQGPTNISNQPIPPEADLGAEFAAVELSPTLLPSSMSTNAASLAPPTISATASVQGASATATASLPTANATGAGIVTQNATPPPNVPIAIGIPIRIITPAPGRWYTITRGRECGLFRSWAEVAPHVLGVPGACFARYSTFGEAWEVYTNAASAGSVQRV